MELKKIPIGQITPYENNPRINTAAIDAVAESIRQCGYISPIIVDEELVVLAGHTRLQALKRLGYEEATVRVMEGLTEEQKRKYRLLDNKTGEFAEWDYNKLAAEIESLDFEGYDFKLGEQDIFADDFNDEFTLPDGDKPESVTMSFNLKDQQWDLIQAALDMITDEEMAETFGNDQRRGNALYTIVLEWTQMNAGGFEDEE